VITASFPGLPCTLVAEGAPSCAVELEGDAVVLTSGPKPDLFLDPAGDGTGPDAGRWRLVRYFALGEHESGLTARVGFFAQSPLGESCRAVLDEIAFSPGAPADLRDES
jgi:hypothetical protein